MSPPPCQRAGERVVSLRLRWFGLRDEVQQHACTTLPQTSCTSLGRDVLQLRLMELLNPSAKRFQTASLAALFGPGHVKFSAAIGNVSQPAHPSYTQPSRCHQDRVVCTIRSSGRARKADKDELQPGPTPSTTRRPRRGPRRRRRKRTRRSRRSRLLVCRHRVAKSSFSNHPSQTRKLATRWRRRPLAKDPSAAAD